MNFIENLSQREKVLLTVALVLVLGYFANTFLLQPYQSEIDELEERKAYLEERLRWAPRIYDGLEQLEENYQLAVSYYRRAEDFLPPKREVPSLVRSVGQLAEEENLAVNSLRPGSIEEEEYYLNLPVSVNLRGEYDDHIYYLHRLQEEFPQLLISSFQIVFDQLVTDNGEPKVLLTLDLNLNLFLRADERGELVGN